MTKIPANSRNSCFYMLVHTTTNKAKKQVEPRNFVQIAQNGHEKTVGQVIMSLVQHLFHAYFSFCNRGEARKSAISGVSFAQSGNRTLFL